MRAASRNPPRSSPLTLSQAKEELKALARSVGALLSHHNKTNSYTLGLLEDTKIQLANSLKLSFKMKCEKLEETCQSLTSRITSVEAENKNLKSQLKDVHKKLAKCTADCAKQGPTRRSSIGCQTMIVSPPPQSPPILPNQVLTPTETGSHGKPLYSSVAGRTVSSPSLNSPPPPHQPPSPRVADSHSRSPKGEENKTLPDNSSKHRDSSPRRELSTARVQAGKTHVLLGDSVYKFIRPDLAFDFPSNRHCQKISVPGMTVDDVLHWLRFIPVNRDVQHLLVHVGINTCLTDVVTRSKWLELRKSLKKVFPNARLVFSSILPPLRKNDSLNKTVEESNIHLAEMCKQEGIHFIDNTPTFRTTNNLPKKSLYHDNLHPSSPHGLTGLTLSIRNLFPSAPDRGPAQSSGAHGNNSSKAQSPSTHAVHDDSRPWRRRTLLPTPLWSPVPVVRRDTPGWSSCQSGDRDRNAWSSHPNQGNPPAPKLGPPFPQDTQQFSHRRQSLLTTADLTAQPPPMKHGGWYPPSHPPFNGPALLPILISLLRTQAF
jgi:hypothetical protein